MFSKGNQGSLLLIPPRSVSNFPRYLHPPISGPSPKRHQGMGGAGGAPPNPQPQGQHCVLKGTTATLPLLCLAPPGPTAGGPSHTQLPLGCSHILCCRSVWAFHLGLLQEVPWTELPDPRCMARLPRKSHTPHFSQNGSAMSWGGSTWPQCREGAGRLPQPCPKTQTFGLRVLEYEQSPKKSKKSRH